MIVPILCFTCGEPIAHLWKKYITAIQKAKGKKENKLDTYQTIYGTGETTVEQKFLDDNGITKYCCRRCFLSTIDLCDKI